MDSPCTLPLPFGEVHVWLADLDVLPAAPTLSPEEWGRAERLRRPLDQARFVARRTLLKALLSRYVSCPPHLLELVTTSTGKPFLAGSPFHFSLSHAHGLALYAFSWRPLGVDLEWVRSDLPFGEMLPHAFTASEQAAFHLAPTHARAELFFRLWTRKEAQLKARGTGFLNEATRTASVHTSPRKNVRTFRPQPGFIATLVDEGTSCTFWRYTEA